MRAEYYSLSTKAAGILTSPLGTCLALWSSRCPLKPKSYHGFHGFQGFYEGTAKRRHFLQPSGCRQRRRHYLVRLDMRMPYAYKFVKSVESVAAFEGAKQSLSLNHRLGMLRDPKMPEIVVASEAI
jgi:hypothetical protein